MLDEYNEWRAQQAERDAAESARIEKLLDGFRTLKFNVKPEHVRTIDAVVSALQRLPYPPAYVEGIRAELLQMLGLDYLDHTYVYLTFWGLEDRAEFMKVGVAKDVKSRMAGIKTGNPMDRLWTYCLLLHSRSEAMRVESALLEKMADSRVSGEWVRTSKLSAQACRAISDDLAAVATEVCGRPIILRVFEG